jgi:hypothetical protein
MTRYINASDICKLLGKKYGFYWTTDNDINRIVFGHKIKPEIQTTFENVPEEVLNNFVNPDLPKKRKIEELIEHVKEISTTDSFPQSSKDFISKFPQDSQKEIERSLTMERGNFKEQELLEKLNVTKTNKISYYTFTEGNQKYKIGCRFDGPQIEIKTRKNKKIGLTRYERVQLTVYMAVSKTNEWILKEIYLDTVEDFPLTFDPVFMDQIKKDIHESWEYHLSK